MSHRIGHIALRVESVRQAERFYARLFDLRLVRSAEPSEDGDSSPPAPRGRWAPDGAGTAPGECVLCRGSFQLVLKGDANEPAAAGRLAHICVRLPAADLDGLACRARSLGCSVEQEDGTLLLRDVYGIRWRVVAGG